MSAQPDPVMRGPGLAQGLARLREDRRALVDEAIERGCERSAGNGEVHVQITVICKGGDVAGLLDPRIEELLKR